MEVDCHVLVLITSGYCGGRGGGGGIVVAALMVGVHQAI